MNSTASVTSERLILRAPRLLDAEPLMAVFGDPDAMRYISDGAVRPIEQVRESLEKKIACLAEHGVTLFSVVERATGVVIGDCGVIPINWTEPEFELGYRFAPSAWGRGYATEAGIAAIEHAWSATSLATIYAVTDLGNEASQRVLAKIGFADDGVTDKYYDETLRFFRLDRPNDRTDGRPANNAP